MRLETGAGPVTVQLETRAAPATVQNFLRYVVAGHYNGGRFQGPFRARFGEVRLFHLHRRKPELDFGGRRNPDGQGFAAFGQVIESMDAVRRIQQSPASGQRLTPPVPIIRAHILEDSR